MNFLAAEILSLSLEHLQLVAITILVAAALGLPGGVMLARRASSRRWVLGVANIAPDHSQPGAVRLPCCRSPESAS